VSNFGESDVLGQNVTDLVHGSTPAKSAVEMVKYLDSVRGVVLFEVNSHLLTESPCPRHQATAVGVT
jgi:hypothetical protein